MTSTNSRIRHTRVFCLLLIPLLVITGSRWPENSLLHELMEFSGHFFVTGGVLLRVLAATYIGGQKNDSIAAGGPFSVVRNPLYVGTFFASLGLAMMTASVTVTLIVAIAFCAYYSFTVQREEAFLRHKFGDCYQSYVERVPRWLPALRLWTEPGELFAKPYYIRRAVLDASAFLLAVPLLEGLCELREKGIAPTLVVLP